MNHAPPPKGAQFRDAMVESCAQLLGKSMAALTLEYEASLSATSGAFAKIQLELAPRDLSDFIIVSTLKSRNLTSIQNACSWLFNLMDITGAGYVLRDEFIRYAPHMSPVADAAVAATIFDELVSADGDFVHEEELTDDGAPEPAAQVGKTSSLLRRRKRGDRAQEESWKDKPREADTDLSDRSPSHDLFPPSVAFQFPVWKNYFDAVLKKYYAEDDEWARVKRQVGIDADEILVKSEPAWVHSDLLPTMGKLFLSQRYLVFFAAVGRNHYVARLGAVADVRENSIPFLMRDCFEVRLKSDKDSAMAGITGSQSSQGRPREHAKRNDSQAPTLSQHIGQIMLQFTAGDKPLSFSLMEFRVTTRRDNWVMLLRELVEAHKLHLKMNFGFTGRASPLENREQHPSHLNGVEEYVGAAEDKSRKRKAVDVNALSRNYLSSPFRNEPPTPLLVIAAHANAARYRALRCVSSRANKGSSLLMFSNANMHASEVNWYVDSVRRYDDWHEKSWIQRLLMSIQENMEANKRVYRVQDDRPFDLGLLAKSIGRFAELCSPMARSIQYLNYLFQWQNPPATILAILFCIGIASYGLVGHLPAMILFGQACWIVENRMNWLGLRLGHATTDEEEQQNVLEMVAQVHDALQAAQNVISRLNIFFGKVQTLCLWRTEEWQSWAAFGAVLFAALVLAFVPLPILFMVFVFFMFGRHFLPPSNPVLKFWNEVPVHVRSLSSNSS